MIRILLLTITVVAVLFGIIFLIGYTAPEENTGEKTEVFSERPIVIWKTLINIDLYDSVKSDVDSVEIIADEDNYARWREIIGKNKYREYHILNRTEPKFLVIELEKSSNGLTGKWTYELIENKETSGTTVIIKEESKITNIITRGIQTIQGRDVNLVKAMKSIRVGLFQNLLHSP